MKKYKAGSHVSAAENRAPIKSRSLRRESRAMSFLKRSPSRSNEVILGKLKIDVYPPIFYAPTI